MDSKNTASSPNGPVAPGDLFVFYGLLKQGALGRPAHIDFEAAGRYLDPCRFRGHMVAVSGYPGVVEGDTLCRGLRYRIEDVSIVPALDRFESVIADDPPASEYVRVRIPLLDDEGAETGEVAWIYRYNRPIAGLAEVPDGDWPLSAGRQRSVGPP